HQAGRFGTADHSLTFSGPPSALTADIAAARKAFGTIEVITRQTVPIPGSVETVDLRAQDRHGAFTSANLRLVRGRYPSSPSEVAVTQRVAHVFGLHVGGSWTVLGASRQVVGIVENPNDLGDAFALRAPTADIVQGEVL